MLELGKTYVSSGAFGAFVDTFETESPSTYLARHASGDWGEVDEHDRRANEYAVANWLRVFSAYTLSSGEKIWVITEADRSSTTILLPSEY